MKKIFALLFGFCLLQQLPAQGIHLDSFNIQRLQTNKTAMLVLGGWALGNIAVGAIAANQNTGSTQYFHRMNMYWNFFNLGLATVSYLSLKNGLGLPLAQTIQEQHSIEKIFLLNAGLDLAYMAGGLYLTERSKNTLKLPERLKGFGQSIMLQGAFLLLFDGTMYAIHHHHGKQLDKAIEHIQLASTENGIGLVVRL